MTSTIDPLTHGAAERPSWFRANLEGEFGPNDWFVEEKYQQFLADPGSVDPIWREYFADNRRAANATEPAAAKAAGSETGRTVDGVTTNGRQVSSGAVPATTGK